MSEKIKDAVKKAYIEVVTNNDGCGCGTSCYSPSEDAKFNESYEQIEGYEQDADYGLGCGIPTEFAKIKTGDTVLDLGAGT